ncbi:hypothetical protein K449DRAFT_203040 [Hypoxylon sp. EC38]|nr:hypothetical protein K449DRAFT_203040 [Hypoxylon sp. EC38]
MASGFNISTSDNTRNNATMDDATAPKLALRARLGHPSISPPIHSGVPSSPSTASWPVSNRSSIQGLSRTSSLSSISNMSSLDLDLPSEPHVLGNNAVSQVKSISSPLSNSLGQDLTRPFQCDACPQSFNEDRDLKRHKRIHSAIKPFFTCRYCGRNYKHESHLKALEDDLRRQRC